ncbi:hypothetical protein DFH28DRAFT_587136 [Melampsora americana]|nr:hypothetical protein DFH28DRAFT_587136 [Melampsora americana]
MLQFERVFKYFCILLYLFNVLVISRPMQLDMVGGATRSLMSDRLPSVGNGLLSFGTDAVGSFGPSQLSKKLLNPNQVARPQKLSNLDSGRGRQAVAATKDVSEFRWNHLPAQRAIIDETNAEEEIKRIGLMILNPKDPGLLPPKGIYNSKADAIDAISVYMTVYEETPGVVSQGVKALRQLVAHDPETQNIAKASLYKLLSRNLSDSSKEKIYLDAVQDDARNFFDQLTMKSFKRVYKNIFPSEALKFWKSFKSGSISEEELVNIMEKKLTEMRNVWNKGSHGLEDGKIWIGVFYNVIRGAKREKLDMFEMLYRYSRPKGLPHGDTSEVFLSKEHQIIAQEACISLAKDQDILGKRYEILLARDANRLFSQSEIPQFLLHLSINGNPALQRASHILSTETASVELEVILAELDRFLQHSIRAPNTWSDDFQQAILIMFNYGQSLIRIDPNHLENPIYQMVSKTLTRASNSEVILEKRIIASEGLSMLNLLSKENGPESSRILGSSYLYSIRTHFASFEKYVNAALQNSITSSKTAGQSSLIREAFLKRISSYENEEMMKLVNNLFKASSEVSTDQKYQNLDAIKTLITIPEDEDIKNADIVASSNWRLILLLNFVAAYALESITNTRLLNHVLGDIEDLTYTSSIVNSRLAQISWRMLDEHVRDTLPSVAAKVVEIYP